MGALIYEPLFWAFILTGFVCGSGITFLITRSSILSRSQAIAERDYAQSQEAFTAEKNALEQTWQAQKSELDQIIAVRDKTLEMKVESLLKLEEQVEKASKEITALEADKASALAKQSEMQKGFEEKEKLFAETREKLKQEFELLANKVFEMQGERQRTNLDLMLKPFKEQLGDFRTRVEQVHETETKGRASLLNEVQNLQKASAKINAEAENLTKALKGDKKLQGNWGELVLERILEESGLRKDFEYFVQPASRNKDGELKRPDVIVRLPDEKDVVVDSKVTLVAYEKAVASESDLERENLLKQYLSDLQMQIKRLADQEYDQLPGVRSLEFTILFIPIEAAFSVAMEMRPNLFSEAFNRKIMLVSPTTLMMSLKIINNLWRVEKQSKSVNEIVNKAGALYDKLVSVITEVDKMGKQLNTLSTTYTTVQSRLSGGRGNLLKQVEHFQELGVETRKKLPTGISEREDT